MFIVFYFIEWSEKNVYFMSAEEEIYEIYIFSLHSMK